MRLGPLGRTGIKVSSLCLGGMMLGRWGNSDHAECTRIVHKALAAGINFIDTADVYSRGESEQIVGNAIKGRRDTVIIATKVHAPMSGTDPNMSGNSRRWITRAVDDSLRRLQTDYIDLYQLHRPDPSTDISETLGVLSDLVHAGKVNAIGSSTFPAEQIVEAQREADLHGYVRLRCEQPPYSIFVRGIEASTLPVCTRFGMGVITWGPLDGGWLTGMYRKDGTIRASGRAQLIPSRFSSSNPANAVKFEAVDKLLEIARDSGLSLTHLSLGFALSHPAITSVIIGPRTMSNVDDLLAGADVVLGDAILDRIDAVVAPGVNLNPADVQYDPLELTQPHLRRRGQGGGDDRRVRSGNAGA